MTTVKVSNVSPKASQKDLKEFFSFSGDIIYVDIQMEDESSQVAYITFTDTQGAETAMLLTGATIIDMTVTITPAQDYQLPMGALPAHELKYTKPLGGAQSALQKAEDMMSTMLAKGFILGQDAIQKAKAFDEKHQLTSTASAKVTSFDKKIGLTEKINMGTTAVNEKVKEMDQKFQVSEKTKTALAAAEQSVTTAGSAIMKNRYVLTGAAWVTGAFDKVASAANDVGVKAKERLSVETEQKQVEDELQRDLANVRLSISPKSVQPDVSVDPFIKVAEPVHGSTKLAVDPVVHMVDPVHGSTTTAATDCVDAPATVADTVPVIEAPAEVEASSVPQAEGSKKPEPVEGLVL